MNSKLRITTGWYFEPPFNVSNSPLFFDRGNWWSDGSGPVSPSAGIYELVRRHPRTGKLLLGLSKPRNPLGRFLVSHGSTSWPRLAPYDRHAFAGMVTSSSVRNLTLRAHDKVEPLKFTPAMSDFGSRQAAVAANGQAELTALARLAKEDAQAGRLILSLAPESDPTMIADAVVRELGAWQEHHHRSPPTLSQMPAERDTTHGRLDKIMRFEQSELERFWDFLKAGKGRGKERQRRQPPQPRKANQNERRAFERVCEDALSSLNGATK